MTKADKSWFTASAFKDSAHETDSSGELPSKLPRVTSVNRSDNALTPDPTESPSPPSRFPRPQKDIPPWSSILALQRNLS